MEPDSQPFDLRDLLWRIRRYSWLLVLPPVAALCAASVYYRLSPVVYEAHVTVSLGDPASVGSAISNMVNTDRSSDRTGRERMALVDAKVRSRSFLNGVAERLGMLSEPAIVAAANATARRYPSLPVEEFVSRFACNILVKQIRLAPLEGSFVQITTIGNTAERAQRLASTITDLLIEENRRSSLERVQTRGEFSKDQVIVYQERLRDAENALQNYQESLLRSALTSTPVSDKNVDDARGIVRAIDQETEQTRDRIDVTRQMWNTYSPGETPPDLKSRTSNELERRLSTLEVNLAVASVSGERSTAEVPGLQANIAATRQSLLLEFENLAAGLPGDLPEAAQTAVAGLATDRAILRSLRSKRDRMSGYISQFARGVENSPHEQMELARLRGAVETNRELLTALQRESQSSQLSEAFASSAMASRLTVVDPPQLPLRPASPDPLRIFGGALLLGPLLSTGLVLAGEKFSLVIRTVEQAEQEMGARILGTVPKIEGWVQREGYLARHWALLSIVLVLVLTGVFHSLNATLLSDKPHHTQAAPTRR